MTREEFTKYYEEIMEDACKTLVSRNKRYGNEDALHNFNEGAKFTSLTPTQTAWGYMTKHLVALKDKISNSDYEDLDDLAEKCKDIINYVAFIYVCANDERNQMKGKEAVAVDDQI